MNKRTPVIVISGFLGSGKTTFLRYLLKNSNKKFGLIINEFGDVGIDGDLVKSCNGCDDSDTDCIIELNNGCLCCTVQDDFIPSIKSLLNFNPDIDAIIIETSGLALPLPLLQALNWPEIRTSIYLDQVIGIVNGESMLKGSPINDLSEITNQYDSLNKIDHKSSIDELFEEQLEVSDLVLISRGDVLNEQEFKSIKNIIKNKFNSTVPILKSINGIVDLKYIFDFELKKDNYKKFITEEHDHNHIELVSDSIKLNYFLDKKEFEKEMVNVLSDSNILRIKGRLWIPKKSLPLQIQIVGKKINTWYEEAPLNCWRPIDSGGLDLVIISFDDVSIKKLIKKIKEKFKILNGP
ncbi:putative cobalamin synthesis protein [Prochlorococcus marinus str. MIT 9515]|uniref:Putative cobalamin synthesis protein n=1 Tax=Prochlorococcus marinus (strain MIT 9515) TaxID=167542 RepID=A2BW53_PROM5|nr:GTP-binding protein [Prochlorococcus marinus]ABM72014.1 putative cobalamin synthesis protein [Prochlorococcus marinus str. MIT 9515]